MIPIFSDVVAFKPILLIGTFNIESTPNVFCEVIAVIAVIAYEPRLVIVFISACIPAPPEESEPAITNILDFNFNLINRFFYNIDTILILYRYYIDIVSILY